MEVTDSTKGMRSFPAERKDGKLGRT